MKKIIFSFSVFGLLTLSACGKKAEDINVADIDTECECVESMNIVMNEYLDALDGKKISDMSEEEKNAFKEDTKSLEEKSDEIKKHCDEKFPDIQIDDITDCSAVEEFKKTMEKVNDLR